MNMQSFDANYVIQTMKKCFYTKLIDILSYYSPPTPFKICRYLHVIPRIPWLAFERLLKAAPEMIHPAARNRRWIPESFFYFLFTSIRGVFGQGFPGSNSRAVPQQVPELHRTRAPGMICAGYSPWRLRNPFIHASLYSYSLL
jgi:hypothetical protein